MTNESTIATLKAARKLISVPKRFTREASARDADGNSTHSTLPAAVCWCSLGAIWHVAGYTKSANDAEAALALAMGGQVSEFNDTHTHPEVLAAFDAAIKRLEQSND